MRATILAAALTVACASVLTGCPKPGSLIKLCDVTYAGLSVRKGQVVDTVRAFCDKPPQSHALKVQIETSVGGEWILWGRAVLTNRIPGGPPGFPVNVSAECREGTYRTHVHVEGTGPDGQPYIFDDHGSEQAFALVQCAK